MKNNNLIRCGTLIVMSLFISTTSTFASTTFSNSEQSTLIETLVNDSELIIRGTLTDMSEGLSIEGIPYTFVSYDVQEVINGEYTSNSITLKYVGGTFANGNRLSASNAPDVKVGEDAILLVQQSIDTGCDFVQCEQGRFRLEQGKVIASNESSIEVDQQGEVNYISEAEHKSNKHTRNIDKQNIRHFINKLRTLEKQHAKKQRRLTKKKRVKSNNINAAFKAYAGLTKAGKAPVMLEPKPTKSITSTHGSQHDQWEVEQIKKNNGNPVLNVHSPYAQD